MGGGSAGFASTPLSEVLGWETTGRLAADVGAVFDAQLAELDQAASSTIDRLVQTSGDYRLAAEYLRARRGGSARVAGLLERLSTEHDPLHRGRLQYEVGRLLFGGSRACSPVVVPSLSDVFDTADRASGAVLVWLDDVEVLPTVTRLVQELGSGLVAFIENQHEVSAPNARLRQGVVKSWFMPDGTRVASKRRNPNKPERFVREQHNLGEVAARVTQNVSRSGSERRVAVLPRTCVLSAGGTAQVYALSRWIDATTVEALLHELPPGPDRLEVLEGYRWLLDFLLDRGILWGDMSPRNVLCERTDDAETWWIFDFEKTTFVEGSVSVGQRLEFCRGQVGVEELAVLCDRDELDTVLHGYFAPDTWNVASAAPQPFPQRVEVADVLLTRGVSRPSEGTYNLVDLEILDVRLPDVDPETRRRRLPGLVGFRVEHYLSCAGVESAGDYDTRTTEVLIAARRAGCFDAVWRLVDDAVGCLERDFVVNDVLGILSRRGGVAPSPIPWTSVQQLTDLLDQLFAARTNENALRASVGLEPCEGDS